MSTTAGIERPRLVRLRDAAPVLDVPLSTLRRLCALGKVPATKVGAVSPVITGGEMPRVDLNTVVPSIPA